MKNDQIYSSRPRDQIFEKGFEFLSFPKNMGGNIGKKYAKNISKSLSGKCRQEIFDYAKKSATDTRATSSKRVIQKKAEGTCDLIGYNIANKIMKFSKNLQLMIWKLLQMSMIMKYLKKDIYLQEKDRKLLMSQD